MTGHVTNLDQKNNGESGNCNSILAQSCSASLRPVDWRGCVYLSFRNGIHPFCTVHASRFCCHYLSGPTRCISFRFLAFYLDYGSPGKAGRRFLLWNHIFRSRCAWSAAGLCCHNFRSASVSTQRSSLFGCIIRVISCRFYFAPNDNSIAVLFPENSSFTSQGHNCDRLRLGGRTSG